MATANFTSRLKPGAAEFAPYVFASVAMVVANVTVCRDSRPGAGALGARQSSVNVTSWSAFGPTSPASGDTDVNQAGAACMSTTLHATGVLPSLRNTVRLTVPNMSADGKAHTCTSPASPLGAHADGHMASGSVHAAPPTENDRRPRSNRSTVTYSVSSPVVAQPSSGWQPPTATTFGGVQTVGDTDGLVDGDADGLALGDAEGDCDGDKEGLVLGLCEGDTDGELLGLPLGLVDGDMLGLTDGLMLGNIDGLLDGLLDGLAEGAELGVEGLKDGLADGNIVGAQSHPLQSYPIASSTSQ